MTRDKESSVDFLVEKLNLKKVNLMKLDIEGEELNALMGSIKTIKKFKPKIALEIHSKELRNKIVNFLKRYGYKLLFEKEKGNMDFICVILKVRTHR